MMKNIWVRKEIWEEIIKEIEKMKINNADITMNRAINNILQEGINALHLQNAPHR